MRLSCIYAHINKINGMIYVGKTVNYYSRMNYYKYNRHYSQFKLYNATQKYGWDDFIFGEIIEICDPNKLNDREKYWIKHLNTYDVSNQNMGYNLTMGGGISTEDSPWFGKRNINHSKRMNGINNPMYSKKRQDLVEINKSRQGRKRTELEKQKQSDSTKGNKHHNFNKERPLHAQEMKNNNPMSYKHIMEKNNCNIENAKLIRKRMLEKR